LKGMTTGATTRCRWPPGAEVRENAKVTTLRDTARKQVKTIKSVIPLLIR
jgi:hypothetical protein